MCAYICVERNRHPFWNKICTRNLSNLTRFLLDGVRIQDEKNRFPFNNVEGRKSFAPFSYSFFFLLPNTAMKNEHEVIRIIDFNLPTSNRRNVLSEFVLISFHFDIECVRVLGWVKKNRYNTIKISRRREKKDCNDNTEPCSFILNEDWKFSALYLNQYNALKMITIFTLPFQKRGLLLVSSEKVRAYGLLKPLFWMAILFSSSFRLQWKWTIAHTHTYN